MVHPRTGGAEPHRPTLATRQRAFWRALAARLAARDPGWRRARRALGATAGAALSLAVNSLIVSAAGQATGVALLGTVVAMVSGLSVTDEGRRAQALTYAVLPVTGSASVALGAALSAHRFVADAVFVLIVFAATTLRRRGPRWSAAGFVAFMTYFFSQFLHATAAQIPWLVLAATVGVAIAAFLRLVVLPEHPERALRRLLRALDGQVAALLERAVDVLERPRVPTRLRRRVLAASGDLNRVALLVERQLGVAPEEERRSDAQALRSQVFMLEVAAAHTVSAVRAGVREGLSDEERAQLAAEITDVSRAIRSGRSSATLARHTDPVTGDAGHEEGHGAHPYRGAMHIRRALGELARSAAALQQGSRSTEAPDMWTSDEDTAPAAPTRDPHLGVKQGLQAAVAVSAAIIVGELLSPQRWYWAAIAAYIVFVGADTRGATLRRAVARTIGTLGGLIGGLFVAWLAAGNTPAALVMIFVLLFAAWWLQPVSFFASSVAVTTVLALLYVLLGTFSNRVLELRVEETAIGALLGGLAAVVLVPARSSSAVREAEAEMLERLADLLRAVRNRSGSGSALRALDNAFQAVRDVARPVAKGVPGAAARQVEQRVFALSAATYSARMLVTATLQMSAMDGRLVDRLERLAEQVTSLAGTARPGGSQAPQAAVGTSGNDDPGDSGSNRPKPNGHPHADPADGGPERDRDLTHALVAVERLETAIRRWQDPLHEPVPPGTPLTDSKRQPAPAGVA